MVVDLVAIHPAYWRRGHAKALMNWGLAVAERNGLDTGIVANTRAVGLYLSLGFEQFELVKIEDEEEPPNFLELVLMKYDRRSGE
jgi:ribosomal protein S18 acetylase RimI-like enzyme